MRKATVALCVVVLVAIAAPVFAQGPFADVPTDHWAYQAVTELQRDGILLGYPDGTFGGKRAVTRYEFAVAIARMIPVIIQRIPPGTGGVSQADFNALKQRVDALENRPTTPGGPTTPTGNFATKADVDNLRRLMDQFRDELAALGVDVDALKRDMAAMGERLTAVERELARVRITGDFATIGIATKSKTGFPVDIDNRPMPAVGTPNADKLLSQVGVLYDADLNISGRITPATSARAMINFGNYLNYIGFVDDYIDTARPTSKNNGLSDAFFPYYLYVDAGFRAGEVQVGRLPMQLTPYTMKKIDVDTYTAITKTDDGNYPVDGGKMTWRFGGVSLMGYAAKHNQNTHLRNGLTSQATGGLFENATFTPTGGHGAGGLATVDQSAGVRAVIGTPFKGNLGVTYLRVAGPNVTSATNTGIAGLTYGQADIYGADLNFAYRRFNVGFEFAQTKPAKSTGGDPFELKKLDKAFDGSLGFNVGGLGLQVGGRSVEYAFTAPGYWDKLGRWANPTNIRGPYVNASYGLTSSVKLVASGTFYKGVNDLGTLVPAAMNDKDDKVWRATAGLKWGISPAWAVDAGADYIRWDPSEGGGKPKEQYWTIGAAWQVNPSAGLKLAYQIIDYKSDGSPVSPYGADYKGNLAVAEFGVKF